MKKSPGRRVTLAELQLRVRNAGDYLGKMLYYEKAAIEATTGMGYHPDEYAEAYRCYCRDLASFVAHARTAWNYMLQSVPDGDARRWLDRRLFEDPLAVFHRALANEDLHDHGIIIAVEQQVKVEGEVTVPILPGNHSFSMPLRVSGFAGVTFYYNLETLELEAKEAYERLIPVLGKQSVTHLALRFFDLLSSTAKSGMRRGRFTAGSARGDSTASESVHNANQTIE